MGKCRFGASLFMCVGHAYENGCIKTKRKVCLCLKTHLFFCFLLFPKRFFFFVFEIFIPPSTCDSDPS